jgi:hypothetical protein
MTRIQEDLERDVSALKEAVDQNRVDLQIQFERIAQLQAEVDRLHAAAKPKVSPKPSEAASSLRSVAADRR